MSALARYHLGALVVFAAVAALLITGSSAGAAPYTSDGITTSVTVSNGLAMPGDTVELTLETTSLVSQGVMLEIEIIRPNGRPVLIRSFDEIELQGGTPHVLSASWQISSRAERGGYLVTVTVIDAGDGHTLHWSGLAASINVGGVEASTATASTSGDFEVWTTIQGTHEIHVLAPVNGAGDNMEVVDVIDYKELTAPGGQWEGTNLLNPHMVLFGLHGNPGSEYAYVSNVSSANTSVIDASAREVVAVLNTGTRTHAVQPSPDGSRALVAAIGAAGIDGCREQFTTPCGQIAEIITDTDNAQFTVGRTYNWTDFPEDSGWEGLVRFDPICASWTPDSRFAYVTLASGGLVVFELNEDPSDPLFDVVRVFPVGTGRGEVAPNGCGVGYSTDGRLMFANSATPTASYYYTFNLRNHRMIRNVNVSNIIQDIHGMMLSPRGDEVVMVGRLSDNFIVLNQKSGSLKRNRSFDLDLGNAFVGSWTQRRDLLTQSSTQTIALQSGDSPNSFYCAFEAGEGTSSGFQSIMQQTVDPAPDLVDFSPDGQYIYVTLRGPNPATGTHSISGFPPGVVVIDFDTGQTVQVVELPGDQQAQDPHGIAVRRMGGQ